MKISLAMPSCPCPVCNAPTPRHLDAPSSYARVDYYRCGRCGHVWTTEKADPQKIRHVTEPPATDDDEDRT